MDESMALHIKWLIEDTPMRSLLDCQITLREIKRIAEVNIKRAQQETEHAS